jgi:hypothetical protein
MGKGANRQLLNNSGVAQSRSGQVFNRGTGLSDFLTPQLETEATNPEGYTPQQLAYMNTASQQSLGGSVGGVTGEANLTAARTRNAGGYQGAIGSGSRAAARQLSQNALWIQTQQANLQQAQRQQALESLQQLYGVDQATAEAYLNSSTNALNAEEQATAQQGKLTQGYIGMGLNELGSPGPAAALGA